MWRVCRLKCYISFYKSEAFIGTDSQTLDSCRLEKNQLFFFFYFFTFVFGEPVPTVYHMIG